MQVNNLKMVIRSHEMKEEGYEIEHDGKLVGGAQDVLGACVARPAWRRCVQVRRRIDGNVRLRNIPPRGDPGPEPTATCWFGPVHPGPN